MTIQKLFIITLCLEAFTAQINEEYKKCIDYNNDSGLCLECSATYFRPLNSSPPIHHSLCQPRERSTFKKTIYISPIGFCADSCNGDEATPYQSIGKAFYALNEIVNSYYYSELHFLLRGGPHYIFRNSIPSEKFTFFRRINTSITISPLYCSYKDIAGCFSNLTSAEVI